MIYKAEKNKKNFECVWTHWTITKSDCKKGRKQINCEVVIDALIGGGCRLSGNELLMYCESVDIDIFEPDYAIAKQLYLSISEQFPVRKMSIKISHDSSHGYTVKYY